MEVQDMDHVVSVIEQQHQEEQSRPRQMQQLAVLARNIKTLHGVWEEYHKGIGGRKPACLFTRSERGKVRHVYAKRKLVWDKISALIRCGDSYEIACDKIYQAYGQNLSVTKIIHAIQTDNKNPIHERRLQI